MRWPSQRYVVGLLFIVLVNLIWTGGGLVLKDVQSEGADPFFITYVAQMMILIYFSIAEKGTGSVKSARYLAPIHVAGNVTYTAALGLTSITSVMIFQATSQLLV